MNRLNLKRAAGMLLAGLMLFMGAVLGSSSADSAMFEGNTASAGQQGQVIQVQNVDELLAAIGPNVTVELAAGEIGLFVVNGDGYIKEWAEDRLHSLNPQYPDIPLHEEDAFRCVGRILGPVDPRDYPSNEETAVLQELMREKAFDDAR